MALPQTTVDYFNQNGLPMTLGLAGLAAYLVNRYSGLEKSGKLIAYAVIAFWAFKSWTSLSALVNNN